MAFNSLLILLGLKGTITPSASSLLHNSSTMLIKKCEQYASVIEGQELIVLIYLTVERQYKNCRFLSYGINLKE